MSFFVLKDEGQPHFSGQYCRFGSYSTVEFVDSPFKATTYQRELDARKRANDAHYPKGSSAILGPYGPGVFSIMKIEVQQWTEDDVS